MGQLHEVEVDDIEDEAEIRDTMGEEFSHGSPLKINNKTGNFVDKNNSSLNEKVSMSDNDVDGLLNWA